MLDDSQRGPATALGHSAPLPGTVQSIAVTNGYAYVAAWEYTGDPAAERLHPEPLIFDTVELTQRSYK